MKRSYITKRSYRMKMGVISLPLCFDNVFCGMFVFYRNETTAIFRENCPVEECWLDESWTSHPVGLWAVSEHLNCPFY